MWQAFGDVTNYVEPFFGSGAVLLARPHEPRIETVNDKDGYVANFWRAVQADPDAVAHYADWPVNENDLHARHSWLVRQKADFVPKLEGDPDYYDARIAGYWVWGVSCWIGGFFCSGKGRWESVDGMLRDTGNEGNGIRRQLPHLGSAGQGIRRGLPHLGDAGKGIHRGLPHLGDAGQGIHEYMHALAERLRGVRVCCGDWSRVCTPSVTIKHGLSGIFLDPPYALEDDEKTVYTHDERGLSNSVYNWAIENGDKREYRIALCGHGGEHEMPDSWTVYEHTRSNGYAATERAKKNRKRERIWFSPHCLDLGMAGWKQIDMFEGGVA